MYMGLGNYRPKGCNQLVFMPLLLMHDTNPVQPAELTTYPFPFELLVT